MDKKKQQRNFNPKPYSPHLLRVTISEHPKPQNRKTPTTKGRTG